MFIVAIIIIFLISFAMALWSLFHEMKKPKEIEDTRSELKHAKVLYIKD